jgi:hypothetical protein
MFHSWMWLSKMLHKRTLLYFIEWRDGLVTTPAVISVKKIFSILKGRDHDSTGWRHLNKPWSKASEQPTNSIAPVDILQCLEHGAALARGFCNSIHKNILLCTCTVSDISSASSWQHIKKEKHIYSRRDCLLSSVCLKQVNNFCFIFGIHKHYWK